MNNKDLIEDIKAKLKNSQELPYREGAWENFASQQTGSFKTNIHPLARFASVAAAAVAILGVSLYVFNGQNSSLTPETKLAQADITFNQNSESPNLLDNSNSVHSQSLDQMDSEEIPLASSNSASKAKASFQQVSLSIVDGIEYSDIMIEDKQQFSIANLKTVEANVKPYQLTTLLDDRQIAKLVPSVTSLAHHTVHNNQITSEEQLIKSNKMSLGDKFQLGLYVSPNRTSDKFDVGAGFLVSYALTKKISLRTGTSYNSYSVGVIKDPMEMASAELVNIENSYNNSLIVTDKITSLRQEMIIPNVNAVMGKVEAIEIPLDVNYQFNKGFYTSAGVSYSSIIKQQREAQYIENIGALSLNDIPALIPEAAQGLNKMNTNTVQSNQNNVNPKGFSGFANFSLGKKVDIKNKMSLSLEPFVKIPLGQFRKSDLDYTNSGIRIITTF